MVDIVIAGNSGHQGMEEIGVQERQGKPQKVRKVGN